MKKISAIIEYLEQSPLGFRSWALSMAAILALRLFVESVIAGLDSKPLSEFMGSLTHSIILFFLLAYLAVVLFVKLLTRESFEKVATFFLWGQWLILIPPLIDLFLFRRSSHWSFYIFDDFLGLINRFFLFFGDNPRVGITYGTRLEVLIAILAVAVYVGVKTRSFWKSLGGLIGAYTIFFILGTLPSWLAYALALIEKIPLSELTATKIAGLFLTPMHFFGFDPRHFEEAIHYRMSLILTPALFGLVLLIQIVIDKVGFWALFRNLRFPQTVFNCGLLLLGIGLGAYYFPHNITIDPFSVLVVINLILAVICAWYFSVFINDIADRNIDILTNQDRPLIKNLFTREQYLDYSLVFLFFSLVAALNVSVKFCLLIIVYHLLTTVYSTYPFRLKRFVGVASLLSSAASLIFLVMGFLLLSDNQALVKFPWPVISLLFVGYSLAIPLKDIKDIEGDRHDGVYTLPVLLGETWARLILASLILGCYFYSVYVFKEGQLFLPALLCGSASFWIITNAKIKPKSVNWQVLIVAAVYVMILTAIVGIKM